MSKLNEVVAIDLYKAITDHGKAETKASGLLNLVVDGAVADGIDLSWWKSPGKESDPLHSQHWLRTNAAIVKAFPAAWGRTFAAPTKSLEDGNEPGQKGDAKYPAPGTKRYIQQQVGSRRAAFERAHKKRLEGPTEQGADQNRTTDRTFVEERLTAIIKRCEKAEDPTFDVVSVIETCRVALGKVQIKLDDII